MGIKGFADSTGRVGEVCKNPGVDLFQFAREQRSSKNGRGYLGIIVQVAKFQDMHVKPMRDAFGKYLKLGDTVLCRYSDGYVIGKIVKIYPCKPSQTSYFLPDQVEIKVLDATRGIEIHNNLVVDSCVVFKHGNS